MKYNIKYTIKYIPKLQIHQHSLLTRKVFSWHSSSIQVFTTTSSSKLDHHQRWIIIQVGSSSKLDHHHHCLRYLEEMVLSLNSTRHRKFYRAILAGCRHSLHVGIHIFNTYIWPWEEPILPPCHKGTTITYDHGRNQSCHHVRKEQHLHLNMGGTNPLAMSERKNTYIWPWEEPILSPC